MIHPKTALNSGQMYNWLEENDKELFEIFSSKNEDSEVVWEYLAWKYNIIGRTQQRMKQTLQLGMFIECKDGKPLSKPLISAASRSIGDVLEFEQASKEVLFEGWELREKRDNGLIIIENGDFLIMFENDGVFYNKMKGIGFSLIEIVERLTIHIPDIKITDNYYTDIFKI